jgi:hypothetical protein
MKFSSSNHSERHLLALWALVFFLLEDVQVTGSEMAPAVLQLALALVSAGSQMICLNSALTQVHILIKLNYFITKLFSLKSPYLGGLTEFCLCRE